MSDRKIYIFIYIDRCCFYYFSSFMLKHWRVPRKTSLQKQLHHCLKKLPAIGVHHLSHSFYTEIFTPPLIISAHIYVIKFGRKQYIKNLTLLGTMPEKFKKKACSAFWMKLRRGMFLNRRSNVSACKQCIQSVKVTAPNLDLSFPETALNFSTQFLNNTCYRTERKYKTWYYCSKKKKKLQSARGCEAFFWS